MKGLLKNNLYATYSNAKVFALFLLALGIFAAAVISQSLQIGYVLTCLVGFCFNAAAVMKSEASSKWGKYKLTLPVKRADIVKSLFLNLLFWLLAGMLMAAAELGLSCLLHGCPFDQPVDILTMFALGISMSLFMAALFFPLFYAGGEERCEVFLILSMLAAFVLDYAIISIVNHFLEPGIPNIIRGAGILLGCSALSFALSCPLTVFLFKRKEY